MLPSFINSYYNVAAGALTEVQASVDQLKLEAANANVTPEQFIQAHLKSKDDIFIASGKIFQETWKRYKIYSEIIDSLVYQPEKELDMDSVKGFFTTFNADVFRATIETHKITLTLNTLVFKILAYYAVILAALFFLLSMTTLNRYHRGHNHHY